MLREAESEYDANTGDKMAHWQRRMMARYTRNLASDRAAICCASVFDLTVAARSIVDDNYGWEVWQMAQSLSGATGKSSDAGNGADLPRERDLVEHARSCVCGGACRVPKQRLMPAGLKARKREKIPGEWAQQTNGDAICSYPPEDLVIEDYGRFLKKKAKSDACRKSASRMEPFTTSILDGIDHARDDSQLA